MKLTGVILDWAGTLVDFGSCAPVAALRDVFASAGVAISAAEARGPMGLAKRAHIEELLKNPRIRKQWKAVHERAPGASDVEELHAAFRPKQLAALEDHSEVIAGIPEAVERMRSRGLKIGTTTGYDRTMLDDLLTRARAQGLMPDYAACPDEVGFGRPHPFMCYLNAIRLGVSPMWTLVKIGDTVADIEEGQNAGMWTIAITRTGNEVGCTAAEWDAANSDDRTRLLLRARVKLSKARPHYFAESVAECDGILDEIDERLQRRGRP